MHFVYMIKNSAGKLYVGITEDPESRLQYHNARKGAKFTKYTSTSFNEAQDKSLSTGISDFAIVFLERQADMSEARKREIQIKKWRREKRNADQKVPRRIIDQTVKTQQGSGFAFAKKHLV